MKTVVITGVGKGIGKATAGRFLANGDRVIGTTQSGAADWSHKNVEIYKLDVRNENDITGCTHSLEGRKIDVLINNAGVLLDEEETDVVVDKLRGTLEVNLIGTINFTEHLIKYLADGAHIINISSSAGSLSRSVTEDHEPYHYPAYKISKTALNMYTVTLASKLIVAGITVSSLHPGWVKTDMGGEEAPRAPEEAAEDIFNLANSKVETGQFWYKGERFPW